MRFLTKIACKNLSRHKLRTFISILAIAFSIIIVILARGFILGMIDSLYRDHIYFDSAHVKITAPEYQIEKRMLPLIYPVDGWQEGNLEEMLADFEKLDSVEHVISRLKFGATVSHGGELISLNGWGVRPEKELEFTNIEDYIAEGRMIAAGSREIIMGRELLNELDRKVGDSVTILYKTAYSSLQGATFKIVGRIESGLQLLNETVFYLPLDTAQRLLYMEGQLTELLLAGENRDSADLILEQTEELIAQNGSAAKYEALSFRETSDLISYMDLAKNVYNAIYILLVSLAAIVVVNTMIMIVNERKREIGMMEALGLEKKNIIQLFLIEGAIMGFIGSFLGAVTGSFLLNYLAQRGIDFASAVSGFDANVLYSSTIYPRSSFGNTVFSFLLGLIVITIATAIPARKAAKLEPTEAMEAR